jgi:hypothetical protein
MNKHRQQSTCYSAWEGGRKPRFCFDARHVVPIPWDVANDTGHCPRRPWLQTRLAIDIASARNGHTL